ncbi:MAG: hypothetical protein LBD75_05075 [Candidatus Peribacteria bacterium]|jgi:hypothetical protein|nr:hypothetical protein [Candidatus Peribacteria bacterium]
MKKTLSDKELSKQLKNVYVQKMMEERGYNVLLDGDGNIKLPYLEAESLLAEENKSLNRFSW